MKLWGVAVASLLCWPDPASAQTRAERDWVNRTATIGNLTVMFDGASGVCQGAGIVVGRDGPKIYVATANHVLRTSPSGTIGVRFRFDRPLSRDEPVEHAATARIVASDEDADVAALVVDDETLSEMVAARADFAQAGDSLHLAPGDPVYAIGCGGGVDWEVPTQLTEVVGFGQKTARQIVTFDRAYVRPGYSGGPLVHVFDSVATIVAMNVRVTGGEGRAVALHEVLRLVRSWKVPVQLTAPSTDARCAYTVSATRIALTGVTRLQEIGVQTQPGCSWGVQPHFDRQLAEREGYWLEVVGPDDRAARWTGYSGPGRVLVFAGIASPCVGQDDSASVRVAGFVIPVTYDGRCDSNPPFPRVGRNPEFARPGPRAVALTDLRAPPIDKSPASAARARQALSSARTDGQFAATAWGCSVFGCRFFEGFESILCDPAVARVEVGASEDQTTHVLDRSACGGVGGQRVICSDSLRLPFALAPGMTAYLRVHFGDGTSSLKRLPVTGQALATHAASKGGVASGFADWTVMESVGKAPAPFAAVTFMPSRHSGTLTSFIAIRECESEGAGIETAHWTVTENPKTRRLSDAFVPPELSLGSYTGVVYTDIAKVAAGDASVVVARNADASGLGPYSYRYNPQALVRMAIDRAGAPVVDCVPFIAGGASCEPRDLLAWLGAKAVKFGPSANECTFETLLDKPRLHPNGTPSNALPQDFRFEVPKEWPAIYFQVTLADGKVTAPTEVKPRRR